MRSARGGKAPPLGQEYPALQDPPEGWGEEKAKAAPMLAPAVDREELRAIDVGLIDVGEQALRYPEDDESIIELASDIASKGLLQPIGVAPLEGGRWQLLWGSRRLAAHRRLRARTILARVYPTRGASIKALALVENLQRVDLSLGEEVDAVAHLHHTEGKSPDQIAALLSKSRAWVLRRLAIPNLPSDLRDAAIDGALPLGSVEEIARCPDASGRAYILQHAVAARLTRAQVVGMVDLYLSAPEISAAVEAGARAIESPAPAPIVYLECAACLQRVPLAELVLIRVCRSGCCNGDPAAAEETL